jgi:hypothetical protein
MAAAILSILILVGCPNDGGPGPDIPPAGGKTVTGVSEITSAVNEVTKGIPLQLNAHVIWSDNSTSNQITWSISSTTVSNTSITSSGLLSVDLSETATLLEVKAAYTADQTKFMTRKFNVTTADITPSVTSISIDPDNGDVVKGNNISLTANVVTDPQNANKAVTWIITSTGHAAGTSLSSSTDTAVTLTVDASESQSSISVQITATLDGTTATATFDIHEPATDDDETTAIDFTRADNAVKLGLPSTTYTTGPTGTLITSMNARSYPGRTDFYNPTPHPDLDKEFDCGNVAGVAPAMAWFIYNNELVVYGEAGNATIIFNVAVINASDGTGWLTGDENHSPYGKTYKRTYIGTGFETIPISNLTEGLISTTAGLSGYKVYIIVRNQANKHDTNDEYDFNKNAYKDRNVIDITPTIP